MVNSYISYSKENRGRVILLFLLFLLAIYELYSSGITGMALICFIPTIVAGIYFVFQYKVTVLWIFVIINYIIMGLNRYYSLPIPLTAMTTLPQIILVMVSIFDIRQKTSIKFGNLMILGISLWLFYIFLQLFNQTCQLPISITDWWRNMFFYGIMFLFAYVIVFTTMTTPTIIMKYFRIWGYLSIAAALWAWRQETFGWDDAEWGWLMAEGGRTHLIGGSIRYFSFFSDAANFGCSIAASAVFFYVLAITTKLKKDKIFFLITALFCTYGFFMSGTRTGLMCFLVGVAMYVLLSKSFKIAIPVAILGGVFLFILAFTEIGQGNMQIRRMRSAFNKNDASANVRDVNKASLKKYMRDAPFGLGFNIDETKVPANHKYKIVYQTSNDSTYVFLWQRVGIVGAVLFAIVNALILLGGCISTLTRLKNKACIGISSGLCCSFLAIQAGGYANHILLQYPNLFLYYGGMAIVYLIPDIEKEFESYETRLYAKQEERKRLKLEKKLASRV